MTRLILCEVARWARAVGAPLVLLATVTFGPALLPSGTMRLVPAGPFFIGWLTTVAAALTWLLLTAVRTVLGPARDHRAAEHLQVLREGAAAEHAHLLCIEQTLGRSPAGQRALISDVHDGTSTDVWLSEAALPSGSFALVVLGNSTGRLVDWMDPAEVAAARRAERKASARRRWQATHAARLAARRARTGAADVIRAAEALLDRH
ncbi:hypothetical protein [Actinotalea fermentans]|uniref:Uncharacterized protein n=1 Tax=Actinotalea fermentans TaxID=43671 RepID=A0A511YYG1_9CELL|nr:hypothetical protein [Actinotalea fermentans]KGM17849.1 hypothetical protein N867_08820 [Actinotalea fermentans ATCC 43279 = JCM 9966 = DSM 3133]GEN80247.1 hypothetical protein AFE02nite_19810 [Actinotalea fermentans]